MRLQLSLGWLGLVRRYRRLVLQIGHALLLAEDVFVVLLVRGEARVDQDRLRERDAN